MSEATSHLQDRLPVESISSIAPTAPRLLRPQQIASSLLKLARGSVVPTVATAFALTGLYAIQGVVLARMLGPKGRGEFGTAVLYTYSLMSIGLLGTSYAVTRRAARDSNTRESLTRSAIRLGVFTGLGTMALVACLSMVALPSDKSFIWPLCIVASLSLPFEHLRLLLLAIDCGAGRFRAYNQNQLCNAALFPLALLLAWYLGATAVWTVVILSLIGPLVGLALRVRGDNTPSLLTGLRSPAPATLLKDGRPYVLSVVSSDLFARLDAFLFMWMASFTAQGYYAAAVSAANMLVVAPGALAMFAFNSGARSGASTNRRTLVRSGIALVCLQVGSALVFALALRPLMLLIYGRAFTGAVPLAFALLSAQAANGFVQVADGYLRGCGKVTVGIWARLIGAVMMVAFSLLFFGRYQEMAIPMAATVAHVCVAATLVGVILVESKNRSQSLTQVHPSNADA